MQNENLKYSLTAQIIHWITALIVLALLSVGFIMVSMDFSPLKLDIYMLHKSFGMTVFGLVLMRIMWRFLNPPPPSLSTHKPWEKTLAHLIHLLLYCGLIGMPLSGWVMSSASEFPVSFFGLFEFPVLTAKDEGIFSLSRTIHEVAAMMLIAAIGLHFLGAAKHHIIDKDSTLRRMGGNLVFLGLGGILLVPPTYFFITELAEALYKKSEIVSLSNDSPDIDQGNILTTSDALWAIDYENSALNIIFTQYGQNVSSKFEKFEGSIQFDPDNLDQSRVQIEIGTDSLKTGSADRDVQAASAEWFASAEYPTAIFQAESFSHLGDNRYEAKGSLIIRDVNLPVTLPFTLDIAEGAYGKRIASMNASIALQRLDFGVGQGQWASEEAIANAVQVNVSLKASQAQ